MRSRRLKNLEATLHSGELTECEQAIEELARSRSPAALQLLFETAQRDEHLCRESAEAAFATLAERRPRLALEHPNSSIRDHAIEVYGRRQSVTAVSELGRLLHNDGVEDVRCRVASALGQIDDASCIPELTAAIQDPELTVRSTVLDALHRIPGVASEQSMVEFLADPDWSLRQQACDLLDSSGWRPQTQRERALWAIIRDRFDEAIRQGQDSVETLVQTTLHVNDPSTRRWAAIALGQVPRRSVRARLKLAMTSENSSVRLAAIEALKLIGDRLEEPVTPPAVRQRPAVTRQDSLFRTAIRMLALVGEP